MGDSGVLAGLFVELQSTDVMSRRRGIRTPTTLKSNGFQDRRRYPESFGLAFPNGIHGCGAQGKLIATERKVRDSNPHILGRTV